HPRRRSAGPRRGPAGVVRRHQPAGPARRAHPGGGADPHRPAPRHRPRPGRAARAAPRRLGELLAAHRAAAAGRRRRPHRERPRPRPHRRGRPPARGLRRGAGRGRASGRRRDRRTRARRHQRRGARGALDPDVEPKGRPMTDRVYVHVGAPKSGTTYLQGVLETNRALLGAAGIRVVGERHLDLVHAGMVIREDPRLERLPATARSAWDRLVAEVRAWEGPVAIISYELLAGASAEQVERALADLTGHEVHVVITARDLAGAVPSAWQERLKFGLTTPLEDWSPRPESAGPRAEWGWRTLD